MHVLKMKIIFLKYQNYFKIMFPKYQNACPENENNILKYQNYFKIMFPKYQNNVSKNVFSGALVLKISKF